MSAVPAQSSTTDQSRDQLKEGGSKTDPDGGSSMMEPGSFKLPSFESRQPLQGAWRLWESAAHSVVEPSQLPVTAQWQTAVVPGTVAQALGIAGLWSATAPRPLHGNDYWYQLQFDGAGRRRLRFAGLATIAEVWLNGAKLFDSDNMFVATEVEVDLLDLNRLVICFRSLERVLAGVRGRVRWRPRMITPASLRAVRTTLLGHMPGWCPSVDAIGPWREIEWLDSGAALATETVTESVTDSIDDSVNESVSKSVANSVASAVLADDAAPLRGARVDLRSKLEGSIGILTLRLTLAANDALATVPAAHAETAKAAAGDAHLYDVASRPKVEMACHGHSVRLNWLDRVTLEGQLQIPAVQPWWPHTHGEPALHAVELGVGQQRFSLGQVGFRAFTVARDPDKRGFAPHLNGQAIFCRGACWSNADLVGLSGSAATYRPWLTQARDAGMNMIRLAGVTTYESDAFFALCDELGLMVWQDLMFANFDYPADPGFALRVEHEVDQLLTRTRLHPSMVVVCGGSEMNQQAAMLGMTESLGAQPLFEHRLAELVAQRRPDLTYVPNSPTGGAWPFMPNQGVCHYYGVGAYQRPLDDARRANVRFTSECLAFANLPEAREPADPQAAVGALGVPAVHDPRWKQAVPRDRGASWDFEDIRDFYLRSLYSVDPPRLRYEDSERYLELSRAVTGELMREVFSEWRRPGSSCNGALVWQLQDLTPGAGWGLIDSFGKPKPAWHMLAQVLKPIQVLLTDEGLNGLEIHLINETTSAVQARLELTCLRDGVTHALDANLDLDLQPREQRSISAAELAGHFFDFTYAYRFGPRAHNVSVATLFDRVTGAVLSEAFHLPERDMHSRFELGLNSQVEQVGDAWFITIDTQRFADSVHVVDATFEPEINWFHLIPGRSRTVRLLPRNSAADHQTAAGATAKTPRGQISALNGLHSEYYG